MIVQNIVSSFEEVAEHTDYERLYFFFFWGGGVLFRCQMFSVTMRKCLLDVLVMFHVCCKIIRLQTGDAPCSNGGEPSLIHPIVILVKKFGCKFSFFYESFGSPRYCSPKKFNLVERGSQFVTLSTKYRCR